MKKIVPQKDRIKDKQNKRHFSEDQNQKNIYSIEPLAYPQSINNPKTRRRLFQRCQNWRNIQ